METYHTKRSKRGSTIEAANNEMIISLNGKQTCSVLHSPQPPLARQPLLDPSYEVSDEDVEGSVYEVNHTNLPPRTPALLRSTRVVMVSEKTDLNVVIRYPSVSSLKTYFGCGIPEMYPALDEKFVMGIKLARKVLKRQVPSQELAEKKHLEGFWLVKSNITQFGSKVVLKNEDVGLAQEPNKNEMVRWGVRRQVMYIERQKEIPEIPSTSSLVQGEKRERKNQHEINGDEDEYVEVELEDIADKEENDAEVETDQEENGSQAEVDKEENEVEAETDKEENDVEAETDKEENDVEAEADKEENVVEAEVCKEENEVEAESDQEDDEAETKPETEEKNRDKKPKTVRKMKCTRNLRKRKKSAMTDPSNRWSKERYMAAELRLLEAMKAKKAIIGNPITRPALRLEARKRIGDTGLLDHLLKQVANEVAPGGKLRFRRSYNASGTMEYWLEDADLLKIRKDAGVTDPFWTPPPGWKPGDSPIQDPIVAKELNNLKEELAYMKKEFLQKNVTDEELAKIRSDQFDVLTSKNKEDQSQAIVVSDFVDTSPKQVIDFCKFLLTSESQSTTDDVDNSMISKEKCKKPGISDFLKKMQDAREDALIELKAINAKSNVLGNNSSGNTNEEKENGGVHMGSGIGGMTSEEDEVANQAANRWTDNIFTMRQWCSNNFPQAKEQFQHLYNESIEMDIDDDNLGGLGILPQEITEQILARLGLTQLVQMRIISRSMNRLISGELFLNVFNGQTDLLSDFAFFAHGRRVSEGEQFGALWGVRPDDPDIIIPLAPIMNHFVQNGEDINLLARYGVLFLFGIAPSDRKGIRLLMVNILTATATPISKPIGLHFDSDFDVTMVPYSLNSPALGYRIIYVQFDQTNLQQPSYSSYTSRDKVWEHVLLPATLVPRGQRLDRNEVGAMMMLMPNEELMSVMSFQLSGNLAYQTHDVNRIFRQALNSHPRPLPFEFFNESNYYHFRLASGPWAAYIAGSASPVQGYEDMLFIQMLLLAVMNPQLDAYELVSILLPHVFENELTFVQHVQIQQRLDSVNIGLVTYTETWGWGICHYRLDLHNGNWTHRTSFSYFGQFESVYSLGCPFFN